MDTTYTEELNLILFFKRALVWWRLFLCAGLIGALLVGALGYVKETRDLAAAAVETASDKSDSILMEDTEADLQADTEEELRAKLTKLEINQVEYFVSLARTLQNNEKYRDASPLMQMDPYHKQTLVMQYIIDGNDSLAPLLTDLYYSRMYSEEAWDQLDTAFGFEPDNTALEELFSINITRSETSGLLNLYLVLTDDISQEAAMQAIADLMETMHNDLVNQGMMHNLRLAESNVRTVYDKDLENRQYNLNSTIKSQSDTLITAQNSMTSEQKALFAMCLEKDSDSYLNFDAEENEAAMSEEEDAADADDAQASAGAAAKDGSDETAAAVADTVGARDLLKYIAIGFILGVFLAALWLLWREMFFCGDSVAAVPALGSLRDARPKGVFEKIFFSPLVYRLVYGKPNAAEQTRSMAQAVANLCAGRQISELTLVGADELSEAAKPVWEAMRSAISSAGVKVTEAALSDAPGTGAQVLVIATGKTRTKNVQILLERAAMMAGKVYGAVTLEM